MEAGVAREVSGLSADGVTGAGAVLAGPTARLLVEANYGISGAVLLWELVCG